MWATDRASPWPSGTTTMPGEGKRSERVAERVRSELMELMLRGAVRDPDAQGVHVSSVRVSDDLSHARIYVRLLEGDPGPRRREQAVAAMERAGKFLRGELAKRMRLRRMPELEFHWDDVVDTAARIEAVLDEVRDEGGGEEGQE